MLFNPYDRTTYLIANDGLIKQARNYFTAPFHILREELWGSHHVKWVKVTSADHPIKECEKYPRFIRVVLAMTFVIPGILCAIFAGVRYGLSDKENILKDHLIQTKKQKQFPLAKFKASETRQLSSASKENILSLPEEILLKQFHVAVNQDPKTRAVLSQVCKYFYRLANDHAVWTSMLSDIGIIISKNNFAKQRANIVIRYREMTTNSDIKAQNLFIRSLFEHPQEFSKLPIVFLNDLVDCSDINIKITNEKINLLSLNSFKLKKAQRHRIALLITAQGYMRLFMKCRSPFLVPVANHTETFLIITPIQINDREMKLSGDAFYRYSTGAVHRGFINFNNSDLKVQIQTVKDLLTGKPCEVASLSYFPNNWNALNLKLQLLQPASSHLL